MSKSIVYLATPYSHPDPAIREQRYHAVNRAAATLMAQGEHIYSPITHCHPLAVAHDMPTNWEFWAEYDGAFLRAAKKMLVLCLPGWRDSVGVTAEIQIAREMGIPVEYMDPHLLSGGTWENCEAGGRHCAGIAHEQSDEQLEEE